MTEITGSATMGRTNVLVALICGNKYIFCSVNV